MSQQIDSKQFDKIMNYIRSGIDSGATLETGGERLGERGYYIKPTVFSNVKVYASLHFNRHNFSINIHILL